MVPSRKSQCGRRANGTRRASRWILPRPPLRDFTQEMEVWNPITGGLRNRQAAIWCGAAPCDPLLEQRSPPPGVGMPERASGRFFGANPVASAS